MPQSDNQTIPLRMVNAIMVVASVLLYGYFFRDEFIRMAGKGMDVLFVGMTALAFGYVAVVVFQSHSLRARIAERVLFIALVAIGVFLAFILMIAARSTQAVPAVHDSAIQTRFAFDLLLQGKNPYVENYYDSPLTEQWGVIYKPEPYVNPALEHYVYFPGQLLLQGSLGYMQQKVFGYQDVGITIIIALLPCLWIFWKLLSKHTEALRFVLIVFLLSPMSFSFFLEGKNDILVFTFLLGALYSLFKKHTLLSGFLIGIAFSMKQHVWILLPLYALFLYAHASGAVVRDRVRQCIAPCIASIALPLATALPFFIWSPQAFIDDTVAVFFGSTHLMYPLSGFGFSAALVALRVRGALETFPGWIIMVPVSVMVLFVFGRKIMKEKTVSMLAAASAVLLVVAQFFSRYLNDNHIGFCIWMLLASFALYYAEQQTTNTQPANPAVGAKP